MKNPFNHDAIQSAGLIGLGDSPAEILAAYIYYIESIVTPNIDAIDHSIPIHDRLLEATLIIFDALLSDKPSLNRLYPELISSPCVLSNFAPIASGLCTRLFIRLDLAPNDLTSKARLHAYMIYFNHWFRVWLKDETPDQSNTMATIDQDLLKLKGWKEWVENAISF